MGFAGLRVLSLESRRATEMESLILREGGEPFVAPSVKERALDDAGAAMRFVEQLEHGEFDMMVCMTGVGLALLRDTCAASMPVERLSAALRRTAIVSRGPKPVPVLRALDVPVAVLIPEPNTWREIVDAVAKRPERRIAIQEYGRPNTLLHSALQKLGCTVTPVAVYRWELPDDVQPLREAVDRIATGRCDVVLFTSSVQLDHLLSVAADAGREDRVRSSLAERIVIASVGPVMTDALLAEGITPDITPRHSKMWALVKAASEEAAGLLARKQTAAARTN
jgi:uroporphyrinogen-III synthase